MLYQHFSSEKVQELLAIKDQDPVYGLRLNTNKTQIFPFEGKKSVLNPKLLIPDNYKEAVTHPYHHAGLYYIQDPSASLAVEMMDLKPNDQVLDLCAAPGGKSTEILNQIPEGFLLANEVNPKRNRRLQGNLKRWGNDRVAVSQASGAILSKTLPHRFDKIIVDAPCSAEGLFRRKKDFMEAYRLDDPNRFTPIQTELLDNAYEMIAPGGIILYATCTLNPFENEGVVRSFLEKHPDCRLLPIEHPLKEGGFDGMSDVARFFPSKHGEGHFMAKIQCGKDTIRKEKLHFKVDKKKKGHNYFSYKDENTMSILFNRPMLDVNVKLMMDGIPYQKMHHGKTQYLPDFSRYPESQKLLPSLEVKLEDAYAYLHGLSLSVDVEDGWYLITYQGYSLGLVKVVKGMAKNYYPKAERNRFVSYP